jgi:sugar phosphate permease
VFGPSLGGILIAAVGVAGCFLLNAVSYVAVVIALLRMDIPARGLVGRASFGQDLREGIALITRNRHLLTVLGVVGAMSFFGRPYIRLMPAVARVVLHVGPKGLGVLQAAPALGTILAVFVVGAVGATARKGRLLVGAAMFTGVMVVLFALSTWFAVSVGLLIIVGTGQALAFAAANTLLQTSVLPHQRGRVMGLYSMVTFGMFGLGALPIGALADVVGVGRSLALGGLAVVALVGALALASPRITRL